MSQCQDLSQSAKRCLDAPCCLLKPLLRVHKSAYGGNAVLLGACKAAPLTAPLHGGLQPRRCYIATTSCVRRRSGGWTAPRTVRGADRPPTAHRGSAQCPSHSKAILAAHMTVGGAHFAFDGHSLHIMQNVACQAGTLQACRSSLPSGACRQLRRQHLKVLITTLAAASLLQNRHGDTSSGTEQKAHNSTTT